MAELVDQVLRPEWLEDFLTQSFFRPCSTHLSNELKRYCTECNRLVCKFCVSETHYDHQTLKVYRHKYQSAISLSTMEKHIDCAGIQPYKCNRSLVIALNPLYPFIKRNAGYSCDICKRKLIDPDSYRYCSISCKVRAVLRKLDDSVPPFITLPQEVKEEPVDLPKEEKEGTSNLPQEEKDETVDVPKEEKEETAEPPKKQTRRRKGIPHRAPFF